MLSLTLRSLPYSLLLIVLAPFCLTAFLKQFLNILSLSGIFVLIALKCCKTEKAQEQLVRDYKEENKELKKALENAEK